MAGEVHLHPRFAAPDVEVQRRAVQPLFTKETACKYLAVSSSTLDRLVRAGEIRALRIGGQVRFRPADIEAFLEAGATRER
jgi:excisionase family DNA binding protein